MNIRVLASPFTPRRLVLAAALAALAAALGSAMAQNAKSGFPQRPLRYITASEPGGSGDIVARLLSPDLSATLGVQVVVDNRPGAGNTIGAELAARSVPDGHTIFGCNIASLAVSPALYRKPGYDPERDFAPLGLIASNPNVLSVHPAVPATTVAQFIELAKSHPGRLNYASAGVGTSPQLSMELFRMQAGINIVHIPYKGVGSALVDLIGGRVDAMFSTVPSLISSYRAGRVRVLAVTSTARDPDMPDVPTVAESGMPGFEVISWQGLCTPAGVPQPHQAKIRHALTAALARPDTRKRFVDQAFQINPMPAEEFAVYIRSERAKWAKVVKDGGIEPR
jgi:tripartite-type tricarboxylate transporter receptor subunit TctC